MVIAWVQDEKLGPVYSRRAFHFGIAAVLAMPLTSLMEAVASTGALAGLRLSASALLFEIVVAAPSIALAWHLNRFHASAQSGQNRLIGM